MSAPTENRVARLESTVLADLTPADRVREVIKAMADGNEASALRIVELCPRRHSTMTDPDYTERLRSIFAISLLAANSIEKYAFAIDQVEMTKNFMVNQNVAALIASDFHEAMMKGVNSNAAGWTRPEEAAATVQAEGSASLVHLFTLWRKGLQARLQAEWEGFDAFCRSELHLDAMTLLTGLKLIDATVLVEMATEGSDGEPNSRVKDLAGEREAYWREGFRTLVNSALRQYRNLAGGGA